jgi:hypothetical protein
MSQNINEPIDPQSPLNPQAAGYDGAPGVLFASQVRDQTGASGGSASGVYTSSEHYNRGARGVRLNLVINPTGAATGTVTLKLQVADPVTSTWSDLNGTSGAFVAVNGTGAPTGVIYTYYPLGTSDTTGSASTGGIVNQQVGPRWRAVATLANAALTFTVGADYLL